MERVSRRRLLAAGGGAVVAGSVVAQVANAQSDKPRRSPWDVTFDIVIDTSAGAPRALGAFYTTGAIYTGGTLGNDGVLPPGAQPIGTIRAWGWRYDTAGTGPGGSVDTVSWEITGRGQIIGGGATLAGRRAILGGTGEFRGANGQVDRVQVGSNGRIILDYSTPYAGT